MGSCGYAHKARICNFLSTYFFIDLLQTVTAEFLSPCHLAAADSQWDLGASVLRVLLRDISQLLGKKALVSGHWSADFTEFFSELPAGRGFGQFWLPLSSCLCGNSATGAMKLGEIK